MKLCPTGKKKYHDSVEAMLQTAHIAWRHSAYHCPVCDFWHIRNDEKRRAKRAASRSAAVREASL